jgi:hypothetical protein
MNTFFSAFQWGLGFWLAFGLLVIIQSTLDHFFGDAE